MAYRAQSTDRRVDNLQPPQSLDAEQAVLGSLLKDSDAAHQVVDILESGSHFYAQKHQTIYEAVLTLYERGDACDITTVADELFKRGTLERIGGRVYLVELAESVASTANVAAHAQIVLDKAMLRDLIQTSNEIVRSCYNQEQEVGNLLDAAEQHIFQISERRLRKTFSSVSSIIKPTIQQIEDFRGEQIRFGVKTGYRDLDTKINGFQNGDLVIIAGRPSMGKTALAMCIAENVAVRQHGSVGIFSIEMSTEALVLRMICGMAGVNQQRVRRGEYSETEFNRITGAAHTLQGSPIFIDDSPMLTPLEMRAKARRLKASNELSLVIVDYIQMMHSTGRVENRQQEVALISRNMKALAKELNIPVIAVSQLSRAAEQRKRPQLADLRESGAIEQDADLVLFVFREEFNFTREEREDDLKKAPFDQKSGKAEVIIAKHRNGETGEVNLAFRKELARFANLETSRLELPSDVEPVEGDEDVPF